MGCSLDITIPYFLMAGWPIKKTLLTSLLAQLLGIQKWKYCIFIIKDYFSDTGKGNNDTVVCSTFVDDGVTIYEEHLQTIRSTQFLERFGDVFKEFFRFTSDVSVATIRIHQVSMFLWWQVHWTGINVNFSAELAAETSWVRVRTDNARSFLKGNPENFHVRVCRNVSWVALKEDTVKSQFNNLCWLIC